MIDDPVIISAIFAGIVSVLGLTFKHIKTSHCWSNEDCCDCTTRGNRNSNSNIIIQAPANIGQAPANIGQAPAIIGQAPAIIEHQPAIIKQDIPEPYPHNESKI